MNENVITFDIRRMRKEYDGSERWRTIGTCVVNVNDKNGTVYLNHKDEIWKLFPRRSENK